MILKQRGMIFVASLLLIIINLNRHLTLIFMNLSTLAQQTVHCLLVYQFHVPMILPKHEIHIVINTFKICKKKKRIKNCTFPENIILTLESVPRVKLFPMIKHQLFPRVCLMPPLFAAFTKQSYGFWNKKIIYVTLQENLKFYEKHLNIYPTTKNMLE